MSQSSSTRPRRGRFSPRSSGWPLVLALVASAVVLPGCASSSRSEPSPARAPESAVAKGWAHALVIDASSSASTLRIYAWLPAGERRLPTIEGAPRSDTPGSREGWRFRVKPGIGDYAGRPEEAARSLEPLINYALEKLGRDPTELARTSLFLRATGGLRSLAAAERDAILESVSTYLASTPFGRTSARVISGAEEGVYAWLTANYLLGHLEHGGPFPTVGTLDLGGASTQITFQPLDNPAEHGSVLLLGGNRYHLYSKSYPGLGQDQARITIGSPDCYPAGYPSPAGTGAGRFDACRRAIRAAFAQPCTEDEAPCSLFGAHQPAVYGDFLALSVYGYATDFFGLGGHLRPEGMAARGRAYCSRNWQERLEEDPEIADDPYLPNYCFSAAHIVTLLTDGFGFAPDTDRVQAPLRLRGEPLDWTLGALLYELAGDAD